MANIMLTAQQNSPALAAEGPNSKVPWRGTRDGLGMTIGWKEALVKEGRVFQITVGAVAAGVLGGGAGTVIDQNQPEFGISVPNGTALILLEAWIGFGTDLNAAGEVAQAMIWADTAAAWAADGTTTEEIPANLISSGGVGNVATAFSAATGDITTPTESRLLAVAAWGASGPTTGGGPGNYTLHYVADVPEILMGPCAIYGYWGATGAATGWATVKFAQVPEARYTV